MYKKKLLIAIGLSFFFAMIICLSISGTISAQDCRILRVIGMQQNQEPIVVSKGDCVVWFNRSAEDIKVIFEDAKKYLSVTKVPMGFTADSSGSYVTNWIPFGGTASLMFIEKGTFEYAVVTKGMEGKKTVGQIEVK